MALVLYFTDLLLLAARRSDLLGATLSLRPPSASLCPLAGSVLYNGWFLPGGGGQDLLVKWIQLNIRNFCILDDNQLLTKSLSYS